MSEKKRGPGQGPGRGPGRIGKKRPIILESAVRLFAKNGVGGTSLVDIAKAAKVPPPLVSYHFPSKDLLLSEVANYVVEDLREFSIKAMLVRKKGVMDRLLGYAVAPILWSQKNPDFASVFLYFYHAASVNEQLRLQNDQVRDAGRKRIALILYEGVEKRELKIPLNRSVEDMAQIVQALITGQSLIGLTENQMGLNVCRRNLESAIRILFE